MKWLYTSKVFPVIYIYIYIYMHILYHGFSLKIGTQPIC